MVLLHPDFVLVVAEYKHGTDEIIVTLPCGVPNKDEEKNAAGFAQCMLREVLEETGIALSHAEALTNHGLGVSPRKSTERYWPVLGYTVEEPIARQESKCDPTEILQAFLMPLAEFARLVHSGKTHDATIGTTMILALRKLLQRKQITEQQLLSVFTV